MHYLKDGPREAASFSGRKLGSDLSVPAGMYVIVIHDDVVRTGWSWHLTRLTEKLISISICTNAGQVVKASTGHIPQPFLISD